MSPTPPRRTKRAHDLRRRKTTRTPLDSQGNVVSLHRPVPRAQAAFATSNNMVSTGATTAVPRRVAGQGTTWTASQSTTVPEPGPATRARQADRVGNMAERRTRFRPTTYTEAFVAAQAIMEEYMGRPPSGHGQAEQSTSQRTVAVAAQGVPTPDLGEHVNRDIHSR